jgi:hypothetical protein
MNETTNPPHDHETIGEAGACPECRAWNISSLHLNDAPYAFLLTFPLSDGHPLALSLVRDWSPSGSDAADAAWATGCNLPRGVMVSEIPLGVAIESGVEMFRLYEGADADKALQVIQALGGAR